MTDLFEPMSEVELLLLGATAPVLSAETRAAHRELLLAAVATSSVVPQQDADVVSLDLARRRRRMGGAVLAGIVLAGVGGGLAVATLTRADPPDKGMVRCFAVATTSFDDESRFLDAGFAVEPGAGAGAGTAASEAISICAATWATGGLSSTPPYVNPLPPDPENPPSDLPVPPMVACVLPEGYVGVFPGPPGTCASLGVPESTA